MAKQKSKTAARKKTMSIAFCGMMCALSVTLMLLGGLVPVMLYAAPLAAAVLLLPVLVEYGRKAAWLTWLATALCVLIIGVDKEAAFFYLFIGYYPILKWDIDRKISCAGWRMAVKGLLFSGITGLMYLLLSLVFPAQSLMTEFGRAGVGMGIVLVVLMVACLSVYDRLLILLVVLYDRRISRKMKFLHR